MRACACLCPRLCPCMLAQGNEDAGFNCVVPGVRYTGAVAILNHRNALTRWREGLSLGTWCGCPSPSSSPSSLRLLCPRLSLASLLLHPECFLIIFKDGHRVLCMKYFTLKVCRDSFIELEKRPCLHMSKLRAKLQVRPFCRLHVCHLEDRPAQFPFCWHSQ